MNIQTGINDNKTVLIRSLLKVTLNYKWQSFKVYLTYNNIDNGKLA